MKAAFLLSVFLWVTSLPAAPDGGKFAGVPEAMRQCVDWGEIAGAVTLVAQDGKILEFDAVGFADLAGRRPMEKDTLFWVASMTKPMTSAAILLLADEGKLALSDPVEKHLPEFKDLWMIEEKSGARMVLKHPSRPVAIRDLLTHTGGLDDIPPPAPGTPLAQAVATAARGPLLFEPGSQWKYGNTGMNALGRIVEVVSGTAFQDFLQQRFFDPLGMKNSTFYPDAEQLKNLAKSYKRPPQWGPIGEVGITMLNGDLSLKTQTVMPAGGLFSTAEDIFRFYQMLLNGGEFEGRRYLKAATVQEMLAPQTGDLKAGFGGGMAWGLGVGVVKDPQGWTGILPAGTWGHDGAYGTSVMAEPRKRLLFIMMIQRGGLNPFGDGPKIRYAFHAAVMKAAD